MADFRIIRHESGNFNRKKFTTSFSGSLKSFIQSHSTPD